MNCVTVREYARLTTAQIPASLDQHTISESAFHYLCDLSAGFRDRQGASLVQLDNHISLRLDSYVGVIETPCGTCLEILPKHIDHPNDAAWARGVLRRMILTAANISPRATGPAQLDRFSGPVSEWIRSAFLHSLDRLVKKGIAHLYGRVEETCRFQRGQLDIVKHLRQPTAHRQLFPIRHDVFSPNRPENRLLRLAIDKVCQTTGTPENWQLSHRLAALFAEIPPAVDPEADFKQWRASRLLAHYQEIKPWCEAILGHGIPYALRGNFHGLSYLFPMEVLFEQQVATSLKHQLPGSVRLIAQARSAWLCKQQDEDRFQLRPDILLESGQTRWVLDTKWKRLDFTLPTTGGRYPTRNSLSHADFYQMFAYGHKYLHGEGDLFLIYPRTRTFDSPQPPFEFSPKLRLWVVPFDLDSNRLLAAESPLPLVTQSIASTYAPEPPKAKTG